VQLENTMEIITRFKAEFTENYVKIRIDNVYAVFDNKCIPGNGVTKTSRAPDLKE
jgi:hypothetical protein